MNTNEDWKGDNQLEQDLGEFFAQNLKRTEILDFVQQKFPQYHWSIATLDRRLRYFGIHYIRLHLHEHGFISIQFHDFETVSKSMRFGSVYTEPFSSENQSRDGISERFTTC